jgi:hypothetical protein
MKRHLEKMSYFSFVSCTDTRKQKVSKINFLSTRGGYYVLYTALLISKLF